VKKFVILIVLLILTPLIFALVVKRVPPATIGIKQSQWAGAGIVAADYTTGFHVGVSGIHKWYFLPAKSHFLHFNAAPGVSSMTDDWAPPLEIRTTDNNEVNFELSVSYRILPGEAHLIVDEGMLLDYRDRVRSTVTAVLRRELPKLTSEDLQDTDMRLTRVVATLPLLNADLAEFHCIADAILIRRLQFQQEYEGKLQEKQYLRQKAMLDTAQTRVAEEEKSVNLIEKQIVAAELKLNQDWDKKVQEKTSEFDVLIARIVADAEVYSAETRAKGDAEAVISEANGQLALEMAEALRSELRTAALNSKGGRILLGLEAAENLNIPTVTLNSDDPSVPMILDLSQLTKLLVGDAE